MNYGLIAKCRSCQSDNVELFFDLGAQPFANSLLDDPSLPGHRYPLALLFCRDCSLVQLNYTADPKELFSQYVWVTGTSSTAIEYSDYFCRQVTRRIDPSASGRLILELASNDGTFLEPFKKAGFDVLGVDPARNIADMAGKNGIDTLCAFWGIDTAVGILSKKQKPAVIIARNVLPHVANLKDFVAGIELCSADDTLVAIEVHYSKIILDQLHYDSVYHEHLCYFTLGSIEPLLKQFGLYVHDILPSPISGGSVVLFISKTEKVPSDMLVNYRNAEKENKVNSIDNWKQFAHDSNEHKQKLLAILSEEKSKQSSISGYGASARSSTLLNFCEINSSYIDAIADQNPMKQSKFTAGSHIPIVSPDEVMKSNPGAIFLLAWNFADEIISILKEKYQYTGRVIVPLPNDPKIIDLDM